MAGKIPAQFIDELLAKVDIVNVIDSRLALKKAGREYVACCPFHSEKTPSFTVSGQKQFYHCFGCGAHGSAIGFLMEFERLGFVDAVEDLASSVGMEVPRDSAIPLNNNKGLYQLLDQALSFYRQQLKHSEHSAKAVKYLMDRGISGEIAAQYGIGYAPPGWDNLLQHFSAQKVAPTQLLEAGLVIKKDNGGFYDRFRDRIMFPIRDTRGRTVAFGGRVLDDSTPKYLNSAESKVFHKGRENYGLFEARVRNKSLEYLIVVEGYMDAVSLAQFGISNVVATLGTATTQAHLEKLFRVVPNIVFCFDGDKAGKQAAWRALEVSLPVITDGRQIHFLFLPEGEDPDSIIRAEGTAQFEQRVKQATPFSVYFIDTLSSDIDTSVVDGRYVLADRAKKLLNKIPDDMFRHMMYEELSKITQKDVEKLSTLSSPSTKLIRKVKNKNADIRMSPVRQAVRLLLEYPELALDVDISKFTDLQLAGIDVLEGLIDCIKQNPNTTCGAILEHYRNRDHGAHLAKLAQIPLSTPEQDAGKEFNDITKYFVKLRAEQKLEQLFLHKSKVSELSANERNEYYQLKEILSTK